MNDEYYRRSITPRELTLIRGVCSGKSNKQIASDTGVTEGTVKVYLSRLLAKTGRSNRTDLAIWAIRLGIVPMPAASVEI